jgi:hypothetical protein
MLRFTKKLLSIGLISALILIPFGSEVLAETQSTKGPTQQERSTAKMAADLLLVRPVGIVAILFGTAVAVVGIPFSALGGNTGESFNKLVVAPTKYTFKRPLGDI